MRKPINVLAVVLILGIFLFLFGCLPKSSVNNAGSDISTTGDDTPKKVCRTVEIPYQVDEEQKEDYTYQVVSTDTERFNQGLVLYGSTSVAVKNTDLKNGTFTVKTTVTTTKGKVFNFSSSQDIMAKETKYFKEEFRIDDNERFTMEYKVFPPKKVVVVNTVTKYAKEEQCS